MPKNPKSFVEKVDEFSALTSIEERCEYINVLLEDIFHIEDGRVIYNEDCDNYQFFSMSGYCCLRLVLSSHGGFEHFELTCD